MNLNHAEQLACKAIEYLASPLVFDKMPMPIRFRTILLNFLKEDLAQKKCKNTILF